MARLQVSASGPVAAPASEVWELLCDTSRYAEWVAATDEVTRTDGPAREGSTYDEINPIAGPWKGRSHWTVTTFDAPHRQVHRGEGLAPTVAWLEIEMAVTPAGDDACEVILILTGESALGPLGAVMFSVLKGQVERDNRKSVENLVALVKSGAPSG
jgi:carbon monoxide dehydrogenase subunit G